MRLESGGYDCKCPHCHVWLRVEASFECDGPPFPDQRVRCPECEKTMLIEQRVVTKATK
jgi:transposase-like protein